MDRGGGVVSATAIFVVVAIGTVVLIGWQLDVGVFKALLPPFVAMNPATAVALILSGLSLEALRNLASPRARIRGRVPAVAVTLIGALKLIGLIAHWSSGIDAILFGSRLEAAAPFPNRMAPNTAAGLFLAGVSLFLLHGRRWLRLAQGLAFLTGLISLTALAGYAYGLQALYGVSTHIPMALQTAFALFLLSLGMLAVRSNEGLMRPLTAPGPGGATARRLLPSAALAALLIGWLRLLGQRRGLYREEVGVALIVVGAIALFSALIWWNARAIERAEAARADAEQALRKSEGFLESIVENLPSMVFVKDAEDLRFVRFNRAGEELMGITREELLGKSDRDLFPPEQADFFIATDREVLRGREAVEIPQEAIRTRHGERLLHTRKVPVYDENGNPRYLLGISEDITARRRAEEEVQHFFDLSLDMLCIAGFDGYFKRLNPAWVRTLGFSVEHLLAKPFIESVHPEDRPATLEEATKLSEGVQTISFLNRYGCSDGSYRWFLWNATADLPRQRIYAAARDVTDRKRSEEEIETLNRELQKRVQELAALNRELEAFSYSVSHDLRAPLRHITGFAEMLAKHGAGTLDEKGNRLLGTISDSAKQMGRLVDDLLVFSRMGRSAMTSEAVTLRALVEDVRRELEVSGEAKGVTWAFNGLPRVHGDPRMLRMVLTNLLSNAVKYTAPRKDPRVEIGSFVESGETVIFVRDNGVGFDPRYAHKLFGVFQRLHSAEEFEGTGIGLANVRRIIDRHGGRTWAEGTVGAGATFYFSLPEAPEVFS